MWRGRESPEQTATERRPDCCKVLYYADNINIIRYNYLSLSCCAWINNSHCLQSELNGRYIFTLFSSSLLSSGIILDNCTKTLALSFPSTSPATAARASRTSEKVCKTFFSSFSLLLLLFFILCFVSPWLVVVSCIIIGVFFAPLRCAINSCIYWPASSSLPRLSLCSSLRSVFI